MGSASWPHCLPCSTICRLARSPLLLVSPSPPLLPVWMNVSSLSPYLLDFHTVRFSVSCGCFLFLNCCPSFGCARRHSVSTYTSIFAGSSHAWSLKNIITKSSALLPCPCHHSSVCHLQSSSIKVVAVTGSGALCGLFSLSLSGWLPPARTTSKM